MYSMKQYLGLKVVSAEPMSKDVAAINGLIRGLDSEWVANEKANGAIAFQRGYKVVYADGYTSWSPLPQFEEAYRPVDGLTFGLAIEALKQGKKVARTGWNGKGWNGTRMWLKLAIQNRTGVDKNAFNAIDFEQDGLWAVLPCICVNTSDGMQPGWLASQTDMFAEDWVIVE
jgi:hypothetical protein